MMNLAYMSDKEVWKPIPGYEDYYEVSNKGRVRSLDRVVMDRGRTRTKRISGRIMRQFFHRDGRPGVHLRKNGKQRNFLVSTLVLKTFRGPRPPGQECRHFPDRDVTNNNLNNLQWGTKRQNEADKIVHETKHNFHKGEKNPRCKLTNEQVLAIRDDTRSDSVLGKLYNVHRNTIHRIKSRQRRDNLGESGSSFKWHNVVGRVAA
jgi:hypothetical protein